MPFDLTSRMWRSALRIVRSITCPGWSVEGDNGRDPPPMGAVACVERIIHLVACSGFLRFPTSQLGDQTSLLAEHRPDVVVLGGM